MHGPEITTDDLAADGPNGVTLSWSIEILDHVDFVIENLVLEIWIVPTGG
jgi:hypothetical protein